MAGMPERVPKAGGGALPIHPLLFTAYPILFLYAGNLAEVTLKEVVPPLGRAVIAAATVLTLCGLLLRDMKRGALITTALVIGWFGYGHLVALAGPVGAPPDTLFASALVVLGVVIAAALILSDAAMRRVTLVLDIVGIALVSLTLVQVIPHQLSQPASASSEKTSAVEPHSGDRDIYYFIFDRYGSERSLDWFAGVRDGLPAWLQSRGFTVEPDSHANYVRTTLSLAATMGMQDLSSAAASKGPGSSDLGPAYQLLQHPEVAKYLKARGYRYIHLGSWFGPTQSIADADVNLRPDAETDFEAVLAATTFRPTLDQLLHVPTIPDKDQIHRDYALFQFRMLQEIPDEPGPKFVFSHILLPHPPYVFDADGDYPSPGEQKQRSDAEAFRQQLAFTDDQIHQVIERLLSGPEETRPIIIIQADEGPYPPRYNADPVHFDWSTATPQELEVKYGILDAMYLPGDPVDPDAAPYDTMTSYNTFRMLFDRYFGAGLPMLPDRSWTSRGFSLPWDMTDITDKLPSLDGTAPPVGQPVPTLPPAPGPSKPNDEGEVRGTRTNRPNQAAARSGG